MQQRSNLRTALILLSIAAMFFIGVVVKRWLFP
ncbi:MAG TPA: cytochrome oxidase small assembly protein [Burkholderiaceae bacterium]|nr:cytochrome oxidase small assembly protein [Burkholderiaceae bacterium]